ncbi:hypothetical protein E8Q33_05600 [Methylophaga sp. SB9B]|uniref:hypothetical protein n=1 Tax=Methylophaga sp. SB9B TaxID=2570356 RepID=UPI0010A86228|nr:hypothetical protein [Methylophaga sp. SB9B]THK41775.1 hypothetical protein E8Q33_05600 [Methylophaga sp. SB9B]
MSDTPIQKNLLSGRFARLLLLALLAMSQGLVFAAASLQYDLQDWQYRWAIHPLLRGSLSGLCQIS